MTVTTNIKAFDRNTSILVKYYDDGHGAELLSCPLCQWSGCCNEARTPSSRGHSVLSCPQCESILGTILHQRRSPDRILGRIGINSAA